MPYLEEGEDVDILLNDDDLHVVESLLTGTKGRGIPCDLYTVSGLPSTDYNNISYFPAELARKIIDTSILKDKIFRVPDPTHHLLSMAYHIVYHKGYDCGIPSKNKNRVEDAKPGHDYAQVLVNCAQKCNKILPELTLEGIDEYLNSQGWRPPRDYLEKLSAKNKWIYDHFFSDPEPINPLWEGFAIFIIRDNGLDSLSEIHSTIEKEGFNIILEDSIVGECREKASNSLRGGNWHKGPWPVTGGLPAYYYVAYDCYPKDPSNELRAKHPGLTNARIFETKTKIRKNFNKNKHKSKHCNIVHSADNPQQAIEYYGMVSGSLRKLAEIEEQAKVLREKFQSIFPVLKELSGHGRRAKVEVIDYNGVKAVCKTFRPGRERFLHREIEARELGRDLPEMSKILEYKDNYIVLEYYENSISEQGFISPLFQSYKFFPIWIVRRIEKIILHYRQLGYELIDFQPHNIIFDKKHGLKVVDFEFMQPVSDKKYSIKGCYAWYCVPKEFGGDVPADWKSRRKLYYRAWYTFIGLPLVLCNRNLPNSLLIVVQFVVCIQLSSLNIVNIVRLKIKNLFMSKKTKIMSI